MGQKARTVSTKANFQQPFIVDFASDWEEYNGKERCRRAVLSYILPLDLPHRKARLCRTKEAQEELIQDSLLRFLKNLAYYTERNSDETAALIVLTMQCQKVDTFRKLHPEKWADWEDEAIEVTVSLKREAESRAFRRSEILLLMEALEPEDRYLLQSYYIAGTSIRALAKSLHITTSAVHMRLLRAKERAVNRWNLSLEEVIK